MSTSIYSIHDKLCEVFGIQSDSPIPNCIFEEIPSNAEYTTQSTWAGNKHTEESKQKISNSHKGMKKPWAGTFSESHKEKIREHFLGKERPDMKRDVLKLKGNDRTESQKMSAKEHSKRMTGRIASNRKPVYFREMQFESVTSAMKFFDLSPNKFYNEYKKYSNLKNR